MIAFTDAAIGIDESDYHISIGLTGHTDGQSGTVILSVSKNVEDQDTALGHEGMHFEFNEQACSGYNLVMRVDCSKNDLIAIVLSSEKAEDIGASGHTIAFKFSRNLDETEIIAVRNICDMTGTDFFR